MYRAGNSALCQELSQFVPGRGYTSVRAVDEIEVSASAIRLVGNLGFSGARFHQNLIPFFRKKDFRGFGCPVRRGSVTATQHPGSHGAEDGAASPSSARAAPAGRCRSALRPCVFVLLTT